MKRIILFLTINLIVLTSFSQYCTVSVDSACDEYISYVEFNSESNTSGCSGGYEDNSAISFNISQGGVGQVAVFNENAYDEDVCGIWIDWNNNQDFSDDPVVTVRDEYGDEYYTAVITCPDNATLGPKRMRIRIVYNDVPHPCGSTTWGETEDYTLNVVSAPEHDMAAVSLISPVSGHNLSNSENITVKYKNVGTSTETDIIVGYFIDYDDIEGEMIWDTIYGDLESLEDTVFTFTVKADLSAETDYEIYAGVSISDDADEGNDIVYANISNSGIQFTVSPEYIAVEKEAGSVNFNVISNTDWTASSNQTWCTVTSSGSGIGTITATFEENTTANSRMAIVTVTETNNAEDLTVAVYQFGSAPSLTVAPLVQEVEYLKGSAEYYVISNVDWTASSNQTWCTVTPSGTGADTVTVNYSENLSLIDRTANIIFIGTGDLRDTVVLRQAGATPYINITPSQRNVSATSGTTDFTITSNTNWTATSDQTWCTVTPSGNGNGTVTVNYTGNSGVAQKTAIITVSGSGVQDKTVSVNQSGLSDIPTAKIISGVVIYPTEGQGEFNIKMTGPESGKVTVRIINMQGVIFDEIQFNKDSQSEIFRVNMSNAVKGLYLVQTIMDNYRDIQRIVVK